MGQADIRNKQTVLSKVEECLLATNAAMATSAACEERQSEMALQLAAEIDAFSVDINLRDEQARQREKKLAADVLDLGTKVATLKRDLRMSSFAEAEARLTADVRQQDLFVAFREMPFLSRLKWLIFGIVLRPAAIPEIKKPDVEAVIDRPRVILAPAAF